MMNLSKLSRLLCRDAVFRVLAVEQPQAVVLNYAPGPLDTPMITELLADQRTDPGKQILSTKIWGVIMIYIAVVRTMFEDLKRSGALLKPEDSALALVAVLRKQNFQSGDHVDFYEDKVKEAVGNVSATPSLPDPVKTE